MRILLHVAILLIKNVRFGSVAALQHDISPTAASRGKAALQHTIFDSEISNVCFSQ